MFGSALATASTADDNLSVTDVVSAWFGWIMLATIIYTVVALVAAILIARKAGYSHWLGVIAVAVPIAGPVFILIFSFAKWPALKERDAALDLLKKNKLSLAPPKESATPKSSGTLPTTSAKDLGKTEVL